MPDESEALPLTVLVGYDAPPPQPHLSPQGSGRPLHQCTRAETCQPSHFWAGKRGGPRLAVQPTMPSQTHCERAGCTSMMPKQQAAKRLGVGGEASFISLRRWKTAFWRTHATAGQGVQNNHHQKWLQAGLRICHHHHCVCLERVGHRRAGSFRPRAAVASSMYGRPPRILLTFLRRLDYCGLFGGKLSPLSARPDLLSCSCYSFAISACCY